MNSYAGVFNHIIDSVTKIFELLINMQPYDVMAWTLLAVVVYTLHGWHKNPRNRFNLADLVCEKGELSSSKFLKTGSWVIMSYGFILLSRQAPESLVAYAPLYGGIWVSARALEKWQQTNNVNVGSTHADTSTHSESYNQTKNDTTITSITLTKTEVDKKKEDTYVEHP
jgi:hypothetical protein